MKHINTKKGYAITLPLLLLAGLGLSGCNHDQNSESSYQINVTNLTNNQPLSPLAVIVHKRDFRAWHIGMPASAGIERLAEGGDSSVLLQMEAGSTPDTNTAMGNGLILPGTTDSVTINSNIGGEVELTVASMLVNTNDGFTGASAVDIASMPFNEPLTLLLHTLDAGTEANDELAANLPGPAGGGEGFNMNRNDRNFITLHPGVISTADGLETSALDGSHRFDNPVARLTITRIH